jgi:hypothetical protein
MKIHKLSNVATGFVACAMILVLPALAAAQTTTTPPKKPAVATPAKPVQAKPAVATAPVAAKPVAATTPVAAKSATAATPVAAKPVAATATAAPVKSATGPTTATGQMAVQPASSQAAIPATSTAASQNIVPASSTAGSVSSVPTAASGQRGAVGLQGTGSFLWGDWTAIAYGCFRSGTRVLCDFDTLKQNPQQANANQLWGGLNLVDDGGRVSGRHEAFFMGDDGSQFQTGYISQTPVRLLMEYDDVSANITHATLVLANQRVQNVPITNADPSQPVGTIPARGAGQAPAAAAEGAPAAPASGAPAANPVDKAQNGVNNAQNQINNVNTQKQKAKSMWDQLKGSVQSTTH